MKLADFRKRFRPEPEKLKDERKHGSIVLRDEVGRPYTGVDPGQTHLDALTGKPRSFENVTITFQCGVCRAPVGNDMHCQACEDRKEAREPK